MMCYPPSDYIIFSLRDFIRAEGRGPDNPNTLLCNAFINSQFNHAPLVSMFSRKKIIFKDSKVSQQSTEGSI